MSYAICSSTNRQSQIAEKPTPYLFYVRESVWLIPIHKPFAWRDVMADKRKARLYPSTWVSYLPAYAARHLL